MQALKASDRGLQEHLTALSKGLRESSASMAKDASLRQLLDLAAELLLELQR
jgi:hypothetical protein